MVLRTTRIDHLPSFELPTEHSLSFPTSYFTNYSVDFSSWYFDEGSTEEEDIDDSKQGSKPGHRLTLGELMSTISIESSSCPEGTTHRAASMPPTNTSQPQPPRRIPKLIHQLDISTCLPPKLYQATQQWSSLSGFEYYFHTNTSLHALIDQDWPEFPHLPSITRCISSFRGYIDLWKALVLWEFGGAIAEFDVKPTEAFAASLLKSNNDDEGIVFSNLETGYPSPFVVLMEPKHPLAHYSVMFTLNKINQHRNMADVDWEAETGDMTFREAFWYFAGFDVGKPNRPVKGFGRKDKVFEGRYNRTLRYVGNMATFIVPSNLEPNWRSNHYPNVTSVDFWNRTCMGITHDYHMNPIAAAY
jgi:hypothetical protein